LSAFSFGETDQVQNLGILDLTRFSQVRLGSVHKSGCSFTLMQEQALLVKTEGKTKTSRLFVPFGSPITVLLAF
jgi:hypothetical protein